MKSEMSLQQISDTEAKNTDANSINRFTALLHAVFQRKHQRLTSVSLWTVPY